MKSYRLSLILGLVILASACAWWSALLGAQAPATSSLQVAPAPAGLTIDVAAFDSAGRIPDVLVPADVTVTVGGRVRSVAWIRRVSRGPGAVTDAAARRLRGDPTIGYVAEPNRTVLLVIDEGSLPIGGERQAIQGAAAFLDRLGMNDRVAVIRLPLPSNKVPALTVERPALRDAINHIAGRIPPEGVKTDGVTPDSSHIGGNPMGARVNRDDQPERPEPIAGGETTGGGPGGLDGLVRALRSVSALPGRKVVAFYSSGLDDRTSGRIAAAARAAAEARASLYVLGLPVPRDPRYSWLDPRLLVQLAQATGGVFVTLGRNPAKDIEPLLPDLEVCFQIGIQPVPEDSDAGVKELRVEPRAGLVVRASSVVASRAPATNDVEPPAAAPVAQPAAPPEPDAYRGAGRLATSTPLPILPPSGGPELDKALGRLSDYAHAYIGQYSAVVAEEDYRQILPQDHRNRRLRSDLLFVKSETAQEWVSFRDVYEVDGKPVRDRDTRLQDLFLTPKPGDQAQLQAIKDESARYNIGPFERNINVPLFPLKMLTPAHKKRFVFSVGRVSDTAGVRTWQLDFVERARPTLVLDREGQDVPLQGHFLVEQATGAIVASTITVERRDYTVSIVVRYVRDSKLGLWVPSEMKETYKVPLRVGVLGTKTDTILEATARYSNFRRFQVSTEMQVIPK